MRFSSRLVLAGSVLGMFAASSGAVLLMPDRAEDTAVPVPELAAAAEPQAPAPVEVAGPAATPITGAQIAALALAPARDRAATLVAERAAAEAAAEAERARAEDEDSSDERRTERDQWRELSDEIRAACEDGRIRGAICRGA